jgi:hypothetical protein
MSTTHPQTPLHWHGDGLPSTDPAGIYQVLADLENPVFIVGTPQGVGAVSGGTAGPGGQGPHLLAAATPSSSPAPRAAPSAGWPWSSAGTWAWPRAGR